MNINEHMQSQYDFFNAIKKNWILFGFTRWIDCAVPSQKDLLIASIQPNDATEKNEIERKKEKEEANDEQGKTVNIDQKSQGTTINYRFVMAKSLSLFLN